MSDIPITLDYLDDLEHLIGKAVDGTLNPNAQLIFNLMKQGYIFDIAPEIISEGIDEDGNYINPELIGLSILTRTGRKDSHAKRRRPYQN